MKLPPKTRRLVVTGCVILVLGGELLRRRWVYYSRAYYHKTLENGRKFDAANLDALGRTSPSIFLPSEARGLDAKYRRRADSLKANARYHAEMYLKYRRLMSHPWEFARSDPPEPEVASLEQGTAQIGP